MPPAKVVSMGVFEQIRWERDIAIEQLKDYGVGFGEKKKDLVEVVRCKDCKYGKKIDDESVKCALIDGKDWCCNNDFCSDGVRRTGNENL